MSNMEYGVQLFSLRKYLKSAEGYRQILSKVKNMGAEVVQISCTLGSDVDAKTLKSLSEQYSLPICVTHSPYMRITQDTEKLAEDHLTFGCKEIGLGMMPKEFRNNNFDRLDEFILAMNTASEKLKKYGITLAYHNHWFEFADVNGQTVFDKLIQNTALNFIPDTFWIKVGGYSPEEYLKKLDGRVNTLHLKDYKKALGVPVFRALGKGDLDFDKIINSAERIGVKYSVAELDFAPNPLKSTSESMKFLEKYKK